MPVMRRYSWISGSRVEERVYLEDSRGSLLEPSKDLEPTKIWMDERGSPENSAFLPSQAG